MSQKIQLDIPISVIASEDGPISYEVAKLTSVFCLPCVPAVSVHVSVLPSGTRLSSHNETVGFQTDYNRALLRRLQNCAVLEGAIIGKVKSVDHPLQVVR